MRHVPELSDVLEAQETKEACNQRAEVVESFALKAVIAIARIRAQFRQPECPLLRAGAPQWKKRATYSWRKARIGSALDARYAGMTAAKEAASSNAPALNAIVVGSADVVS